MNEIFEQFLLGVRSVLINRNLAVICAWLLFALGTLYIMLQKDVYEASARVYVDVESQLRRLLDDQIVESDLEEKLRFVRESLLSHNRLENVARNAGLIDDSFSELERSQVAGALRNSISIIAATEQTRVRGRGPRTDDTYTITFEYSDQTVALEVVASLLDLFVSDTLKGNIDSSELAGSFLNEQVREYETRLREAELRLAEFNRENIHRLPGSQGGYFQQLQSASSGLADVNQRLQLARSRLDVVNSRLSGESAPLVSADDPNSIAAQILEAQRRLDELRLRFTEAHPDVTSQLSLLKTLRERQQNQLEELEQGADYAASLNPVIQALQITKNEILSEIATLEAERQYSQQLVDNLEASIDEIPAVEAELARLNRDYNVINQQYQTLLNSLERERLTRNVVKTEELDLRVIQPPSVTSHPVAPRRVVLHGLVLVFSIGAGIALAIIKAQLNPVIHSSEQLRKMVDFPTIGEISAITNSEGTTTLSFVFAATSLFVLLVTALIFVWQAQIGNALTL